MGRYRKIRRQSSYQDACIGSDGRFGVELGFRQVFQQFVIRDTIRELMMKSAVGVEIEREPLREASVP